MVAGPARRPPPLPSAHRGATCSTLSPVRPRFSVVITVRDRADVIGRAVASVLAQTFANHEVIVVDRRSEDGTLAAVRAVADRRVRIVEGPEDETGARQAGVDASRARWFAVLDPDDEVSPGWLARVGRLIDSNDAELVSCGGAQLHLDGSSTRVLPERLGRGDVRVCYRSGACVATRRLLDEVGGFEGDTAAERDGVDVWRAMTDAALAAGRAVVHTPEPLVQWTERAGGSDVPSGDRLQLRCSLQGLDALSRTPLPDGDLLTRYAVSGGLAAARLRDREQARHLFRLARRLEPRVARHWARWATALVPPIADRVWDVGDVQPATSEIAGAGAR